MGRCVISPRLRSHDMHSPHFSRFWCSQDNGGVIVNISATIQYRGSSLVMHAGAAKAAVDTMTKHLAIEWGCNGIRVVGVAPGPIEDTEGMQKLGRGINRDAMVSRIPLGRMGTREDMANTVLYTVSDAASYVTGTVIVADEVNAVLDLMDLQRKKVWCKASVTKRGNNFYPGIQFVIHLSDHRLSKKTQIYANVLTTGLSDLYQSASRIVEDAKNNITATDFNLPKTTNLMRTNMRPSS
ncbi:hypothetical protein ScPMuIL_004829 [Solemya velum]